MQTPALRVALFSGNYNYVRDGANQALNKLVGYLLKQGVVVRVYSPVTDTPAFAPTGDLVPLPSRPFPGRSEYHFPLGMSDAARADLEAFAPDIIHVSSPDLSGRAAIKFARGRGLPVVASVHTRFDTYPRYYKLHILEPVLRAILRRFYRRCAALLAPSESFADILRSQRMNFDIGIWARGIDTSIFNTKRRSLDWRRSIGIKDDEVAICFFGRIVMEKGLDVFADSIDELVARDVPHRILVIGDGPAREWLAKRLPSAIFTGFQSGADLGRAVASADILLNPSVTETFGNVTTEMMASGLPVVAADATGSSSIVKDGVTGRLIPPGNITAYADALEAYCRNPELRRTHGRAAEEESRRYDWDRVNQAVLDTYLRVLEKSK